MPVGAYGGRRDIMQHVLPAGKVFQAGTLSGNPIACAAGIATLTELKQRPPYATLRSEEHTSELQSLMRISYAVFCLKKKKNTMTNKEISHYADPSTTQN